MENQCALTLVTPIIPGKEDELNSILMKIRANLASGSFKEFEQIDTLHYARYVLLKYEDATITNLVFSSDYDGVEDEHLLLLGTQCGDLLDQLYSYCEGYPAASDRNPANRAKYLKQWANKDAAFYIGARGRSLKQIKQESSLRDAIWKFLKDNKWQADATAKEVHSKVRQFVLGQPGFAWANEEVKYPKLKIGNFILIGTIALLLLPIAIPLVGIWLLAVRAHEKKDIPLNKTPSQINDDFIKTLEEYEDYHNQNQFTQIVPMRPGKFRLITIQAILLYGKFRVYNEFVKGALMGIPTIHFARWVILDKGKQVLFFSNFDGSWQQYLGDFIDKSGWGLTAIFSNTKNFPPSRYLFWGGAYDEEHFLAWARYTQVPTQVWYSAYPKLSIKNVNTNTMIRIEVLKNNLSEEQAQTFLNRF